MRQMNQPLTTLVFTSLLFLLSGCGLFASSSNGGSAQTAAGSGNSPIEIPMESASDAPTPQGSVTNTPVPGDVQVYQDDSGMFALALPEGYVYEKTEQGLSFTSDDGGFAGEIVYQTTNTPSSKLFDLEQRLKDIIEPKFEDIDWQRSGQRQPDGSVRLAWQARNEAGQEVDALSFIETHGENTFALMLYSVDKVYNDYSDDARIIVGTYVVRQGPAIADSPADTDSETEADANTETNKEI